MKENKLTEQEFWEQYWDNRTSGIEVKKEKKNLFVNEILNVFDKYLPVNQNYTVLEIGGAPGQYLIYFVKNFGYKAHSLDYSRNGNIQTERNFKQAGIPITIYEADLFAPDKNLPRFDVVYSLGLIEHFDDPLKAVEKHVELLKPGGILILGAPNLTGIYHRFLKTLSPDHDKTHNLKTMDLANWERFEKALPITPLFKGYVGGFEPLIMKKKDVTTAWAKFLGFIVKGLVFTFSSRFRFLRRYNSRRWSGYLMGIYRKTE